jgi:branched-chain amino acid transport system ATP-binding protein
MLALNNIEVISDHVILVLKGVSLAVEEGRITTLLGANGRGRRRRSRPSRESCGA